MNTRTLRLLEYNKVKDMLLKHVSSSIGKSYIERMKPGRDINVVKGRMAETTEAKLLLTDAGDAPLQGLHDVREAVTRAQKRAILTPEELLDIAETAACSRRLHRYLANTAGQYEHISSHRASLNEFPKIEKAIDGAIAPTGEVLDSSSPDLEKARKRVRSLNDALQRELQRIISSPSITDQLQDPIITQRNARFCVPVRAECRNSFKGIVHDLSASGQTAFMEPLSIVELGNDLREAEQQEQEEIQRVLSSISSVVGADASRFLESIDTAGRIDAIFGRALFARAIDGTEPELNTDGVIDLKSARHPLLGQIAVPIDISLGIDGNNALLITGPNTGGKTVTLKTVGLLTMMAQSGLHIPAAAGSRIAIFTDVFADIGDEQSIEQSLSTFSSHMTNIIHIIRDAGEQSLVLFDEIGAGTDPAEGAALAKAILLELNEKGCRTIATTHYGELKIFGQNTQGFANASVEFDITTLQPTYRIISGLPGSSNALSISQRLGLSKKLVSRAKELMGEAPQAMEQVLKQAEGARRSLDRERTAAVLARKEVEARLAALKHEQKEFEDKREAALAKARQKSQEILQNARVEANALLDELRTAVREARTQSQNNVPVETAYLKRRTRQVLGGISEQVESLPAKPVIVEEPSKPALTEVAAGQNVYVRSIGHRGIALESGSSDAEVEVQVGIMRVRVPVSDLEATGKSQQAPVLNKSVKEVPQIEKEILLLGKRAEEAENDLEAYLYEALEAGFESVRIVHGFGTGTLRQVVRDMLRQHPAVQSYRAGQPQEGGGGVTVATLR
ncbi:MAG TPA: endonuclease MutS2 [Armatimonadota bacterium]|nr:endonuclease MutS2 [Armatimonadota bacterium]